jgi:molecular chaperone HscB
MPNQNYFQFMGVEEKINFNSNELQKKFYALSKDFHPDRFQNAAAADREAIEANAATLNAAFNTLKDRTKRIQYLIGLYVGEQPKASNQVPKDLLFEVMEMQEKLEDYAASKNEAMRVSLTNTEFNLNEKLSYYDTEIKTLSQRFDAATSTEEKKSVLTDIHQVELKKNYIRTLVATLRETLSPDPLGYGDSVFRH